MKKTDYISSYGTELTNSSLRVESIMGFVRGKTVATNTYVKVTLQKRYLSYGRMPNCGKQAERTYQTKKYLFKSKQFDLDH